MSPSVRISLGVIFSITTTLVLMWAASRFPGMDIPTAYWIFGAVCPAVVSAPVCAVTTMQGERNRRLTQELRAALASLQTLADTDQMTGLINRATFFRRACDASAEISGAFLLVDVDNFKAVNDLHGHAVGDLVLQGVASVLEAGVRPTDLCARMGGEEFAIFLAGADQDSALCVAERLRKAVTGIRVEAGGAEPVSPTVSIGVSVDPNIVAVDDGLRRADRAMYSAKRLGRNQVALA